MRKLLLSHRLQLNKIACADVAQPAQLLLLSNATNERHALDGHLQEQHCDAEEDEEEKYACVGGARDGALGGVRTVAM